MKKATLAVLETPQFATAIVYGVGRVEDENGERMGTCLIVRYLGKLGGIWYDRDKDPQGTLTFVPVSEKI